MRSQSSISSSRTWQGLMIDDVVPHQKDPYYWLLYYNRSYRLLSYLWIKINNDADLLSLPSAHVEERNKEADGAPLRNPHVYRGRRGSCASTRRETFVVSRWKQVSFIAIVSLSFVAMKRIKERRRRSAYGWNRSNSLTALQSFPAAWRPNSTSRGVHDWTNRACCWSVMKHIPRRYPVPSRNQWSLENILWNINEPHWNFCFFL